METCHLRSVVCLTCIFSKTPWDDTLERHPPNTSAIMPKIFAMLVRRMSHLLHSSKAHMETPDSLAVLHFFSWQWYGDSCKVKQWKIGTPFSDGLRPRKLGNPLVHIMFETFIIPFDFQRSMCRSKFSFARSPYVSIGFSLRGRLVVRII